MLRRGQLSRIRGSKPQSPVVWRQCWIPLVNWTSTIFFSLKVKYRTKWAIYAIEKPVKLLEGKVLDVFFRFAVCHIGIHWCFLTSENVEQTAASLCNLWITCTYIHTHTYIYIFIHVCTHVCLYGCLWCQHMPRFIIPQSLRQHAEPGTMTCVEMRPIAPGWVDHGPAIQRPGPSGPHGHGHTAAIEVPSMKRGNGSAIPQSLRQHAEPGTMTCVEMRPIAPGWVDHGPAIQRPGPSGPHGHGHTAAIEVPSMKRGNGSARAGAMRASSWTQILRELSGAWMTCVWWACRCFGTSVLGVEHVPFFKNMFQIWT